MLTLENIEITGIEHTVRGMRNPLNSWAMSDSAFIGNPGEQAYLGDKDFDLMKRLNKAGTDHRKYMRMMVVYMDITAPLYWWKEFDTYKVGTVANSCSTMHKIAAKEFEPIDFSWEHIDKSMFGGVCNDILAGLNVARDCHLQAKKEKDEEWAKHYWWQMIQLLPSSYNQKRTVMLNYEVLANIYKSRKTHKLDEWRYFCEQIVAQLPYSELITGDF